MFSAEHWADPDSVVVCCWGHWRTTCHNTGPLVDNLHPQQPKVHQAPPPPIQLTATSIVGFCFILCIFFPRQSAQAHVLLLKRSNTSGKKNPPHLPPHFSGGTTNRKKGCSRTTRCKQPTSFSPSSLPLLSVEGKKQPGMFLFFPYRNNIGLEIGNTPEPQSAGWSGRNPPKKKTWTKSKYLRPSRRLCKTDMNDISPPQKKQSVGTLRCNLMVFWKDKVSILVVLMLIPLRYLPSPCHILKIENISWTEYNPLLTPTHSLHFFFILLSLFIIVIIIIY